MDKEAKKPGQMDKEKERPIHICLTSMLTYNMLTPASYIQARIVIVVHDEERTTLFFYVEKYMGLKVLLNLGSPLKAEFL